MISKNKYFLKLFILGNTSQIPQASGGQAAFRSHLPRPYVLGRSGSSSSSKAGTKSPASNYQADLVLDDDSGSDDSDELVQQIVNRGLAKSKPDPKSKEKVKLREKKKKATSKSPRNSKVIPGVAINELKLKPRSSDNLAQFQQDQDLATPVVEVPKDITEAHADDPSDVNGAPDEVVVNFEEISQEAKRLSAHIDNEADDMLASICSTLSTIQPPSMTESLLSFSEAKESQSTGKVNSSRGPPSVSKIECRHSVSQKSGNGIPAVVSRALGVSNSSGLLEDMSSSVSSCQSNLDNIRPPTLMENMDNSILSITSITSEIAPEGLNINTESLNSEQIIELVKPSADAVEALVRNAAAQLTSSMDNSTLEARIMSMKKNSQDDDTQIVDVAPPTLMDDISGVQSSLTLVAPNQDGATYVIDPAVDDQSTYRDITDVFDDDTTMEPTLTLESDVNDDDAPELPSDSRKSTPASSRGNSKEGTPNTKRKANSVNPAEFGTPVSIEHFKKFRVPVPDLDDSSDLQHDTSGYKTETNSLSQVPSVPGSDQKLDNNNATSRQRRKEDSDRFRTHTITKEDLSPKPTPPKNPSSVKQRREDEAERFRTRTIHPSDLKPRALHFDAEPENGSLEQNAQLVVDALAETRNNIKSRSSSVDDLLERSMIQSMEILEEEQLSNLKIEIGGSDPHVDRVGPRICKPSDTARLDETREPRAQGIRGRRKPLYSPRSTLPVNNEAKPAIATKPNIAVSKRSPQGGVRAKSSSNLSSLPSPRVANGSAKKMPVPLVRQGTFTKDDKPEEPQPRTTPPKPTRAVPQPSLRKDAVHPMQRPPLSSPRGTKQPMERPRIGDKSKVPKIPQTKTTQLRERSLSRQVSNSSRDSNLRHINSSSSSSLNSTRSGRSNISTPSSKYTHSPQNTLKQTPSPNSKVPSSPSVTQVSKPEPKEKKAVTSKIASLWKQVEDSKKKTKNDKNDPRKWITKGKPIPENELALLKPHNEQQKIISNFQAQRKLSSGKIDANVSNGSANSIKPRSKSRLAIKLSKFSSKSKDCKADTSATSTPTESPAITLQDSVNGNAVDQNVNDIENSTITSEQVTLDDQNGTATELASGIVASTPRISEEETPNKRHSRLGTFFNPETEEGSNTTPITFRSLNRSPASAIVQPYNYNPPNPNANQETPVKDTAGERCISIKRNDSYVSSMGRKEDHSKRKPADRVQRSSSTLTTLV